MGDPVTIAVTMGLKMMEQRAQAKAQENAARTRANAEMTRARQAQDIRNRQRGEQLKRRLATQRARFGASGAASRGGSADAVLQGLRNETNRQIGDEEASLGTQFAGLEDQVRNVRRQGLLERRSFLTSAATGYGLEGFNRLRTKKNLFE